MLHKEMYIFVNCDDSYYSSRPKSGSLNVCHKPRSSKLHPSTKFPELFDLPEIGAVYEVTQLQIKFLFALYSITGLQETSCI